MKNDDPHKWMHVTNEHSGVPGDVSTEIRWCRRCGTLRRTVDWGGKDEMIEPQNVKRCKGE